MTVDTEAPHHGRPAPSGDALVEVEHLTIRFPVGRSGFWGRQVRHVHAVEDVSFSIGHGETLGLVGESGSGKSTIGRAVLRRIPPTAGTIRFRGADITATTGDELRRLRQHMQLVFQDPYASLNPRMTVLELIAEPLVVHGRAKSPAAARDEVVSLLERCGLPADMARARFFSNQWITTMFRRKLPQKLEPRAITMKANSPACAIRIAASTVTPGFTRKMRHAP